VVHDSIRSSVSCGICDSGVLPGAHESGGLSGRARLGGDGVEGEGRGTAAIARGVSAGGLHPDVPGRGSEDRDSVDDAGFWGRSGGSASSCRCRRRRMFSIACLVGGDRRIAAWWKEAVAETLREIEAVAETRVRKGGGAGAPS